MIDPELINMNDQVILRGLTKKGQERIRDHGTIWIALSTMGGNILFKSIKDGYMKWLSPDLEPVALKGLEE